MFTKTGGFAYLGEKRQNFYRDESFITSRIKVSVYRDKKNVVSRQEFQGHGDFTLFPFI